jgi:hypothetical protein
VVPIWVSVRFLDSKKKSLGLILVGCTSNDGIVVAFLLKALSIYSKMNFSLG